MLDAVRDDQPTLALLPRTTRKGDLIGLRVMAHLHRLALERRAPALAIHLPTLGGTAPQTDRARAALRTAVHQTLSDHPPASALSRVPQTNEPGRAAIWRSLLSDIARTWPGRGVRVIEPGASAGLNLRADHLPGNPDLEVGPLPAVVERLGCDLHPIDPFTTEGRTQLTSYVWVDDVTRFGALAHALEVAQRVPATVIRAEASDFVRAQLPRPGTVLVVWHSALAMYLSATDRADLDAAIASVGALASPDAPVVHAAWEWDPQGQPGDFALAVRAWTGATTAMPPMIHVRGASHGSPASRVPGASILGPDPGRSRPDHGSADG